MSRVKEGESVVPPRFWECVTNKVEILTEDLRTIEGFFCEDVFGLKCEPKLRSQSFG